MKHLPVLERLDAIIKLEIPYKFGIIDKADYDAGRKYELFHSYYKYVNFFHITAEYMHMNSNFTDYVHNLKDSITLEEIIYGVSRETDIGFPFWERLRIEYEIRDYRLTQLERPRRNINTNNRLVILTKKNNARKDITEMQINNITILFMFENVYTEYTFIYKNNLTGEFRKMVIKANMKDIEYDIMRGIKQAENVKTVYNCIGEGVNEYIKLLKFPKDSKVKNYIILEDVGITDVDLRFIFFHTGLTKRKLEYPGTEQKISIKYFYTNSLLPDTNQDLQVYNIYNEIPVLVKNYQLTEDYVNRTHQKCQRNLYNTNRGRFKQCAELLGIKDCVINCIHFNVNNCGYDFIEIIDTKNNFNNDNNDNISKNDYKKTVYIMPTIGSKDINIGNFLGLRQIHLPMLKEFYKIYKNANTFCYLHRVSILPKFYTIHFHVWDANLYIRNFKDSNVGSYILQDIHLSNLINILDVDENYFAKYNINFLIN